MNRNEVISLLQAVSASDNRQAGELDVTIWSEVLGTMRLDDCLAALVTFRRESPGVWLEPGHIVRLVRDSLKVQYEQQQLTAEEQRRIERHTREQELMAGLTPEERQRAFITPEGEVCVPASREHREKCMAEIRAILSKPGRRFGLSPEAAY